MFTSRLFWHVPEHVYLILQIIHFWSIGIGIIRTKELLNHLDSKLNEHIIIKVHKLLRNVAAWAYKKENVQLGGQGMIVEIDETLMFKVKYNRGNALKRKQVWVFGLVEKEGKNGARKKCYMEIVKNHKAETLLRIIYDRVLPGTTIVSNSIVIHISKTKKCKSQKNKQTNN